MKGKDLEKVTIWAKYVEYKEDDIDFSQTIFFFIDHNNRSLLAFEKQMDEDYKASTSGYSVSYVKLCSIFKEDLPRLKSKLDVYLKFEGLG